MATPSHGERRRVRRHPVDHRGAVGLDRRRGASAPITPSTAWPARCPSFADAPRSRLADLDGPVTHRMRAASRPMITTTRSSQRSHEVSVEKMAFVTSGARWSAPSRTACRSTGAPASRRSSRRRRRRARSPRAGARVEEDRRDREEERPAPQRPAQRGRQVEVVLDLVELATLGEGDQDVLVALRYGVRGRAGGSPFVEGVIAASSCGVTSRPSWLAFCSFEPLLVIAVTNASCRRRIFDGPDRWNFGDARTVADIGELVRDHGRRIGAKETQRRREPLLDARTRRSGA